MSLFALREMGYQLKHNPSDNMGTLHYQIYSLTTIH